MKVLLIDVNCKHSSTGSIVYNLYNAINNSFDEHGNQNEACVCYGRGEKIEGEKNIYKFGIDIETYIHAFLTRITGYNGRYSYFSTKRLIKKIEEFKPDVVHLHELHAYFLNHKMLFDYLKKNNYPIVYTLHCEYAYTGKCGYAYDCENYINGCGKCPHLNDYITTAFFDKTKEMFKEKVKEISGCNIIFVTPSQWLKEKAEKSFLEKYEIETIHNGINTKKFFYDEDGLKEVKNRLNISDDDKIVLSVAPDILGERKGGKTLLDLAKNDGDENKNLEVDSSFCEYGDVNTLYSIINKMLKEKYDKIELSKKAKEIYSIDNMFHNYYDIYLQVLKKGLKYEH